MYSIYPYATQLSILFQGRELQSDTNLTCDSSSGSGPGKVMIASSATLILVIILSWLKEAEHSSKPNSCRGTTSDLGRVSLGQENWVKMENESAEMGDIKASRACTSLTPLVDAAEIADPILGSLPGTTGPMRLNCQANGTERVVSSSDLAD